MISDVFEKITKIFQNKFFDQSSKNAYFSCFFKRCASIFADRRVFRAVVLTITKTKNDLHNKLIESSFEIFQKNIFPEFDNTFNNGKVSCLASSYLRCSWDLSVATKTLLGTFVASNQLYTLTRSFSESFKKFSVLIFTLLTPSIWPHTASQRGP